MKKQQRTPDIKPLLQQAAHKLEALEFGSALALYQQALALAPNNAGATMGLVMTYNRIGQPQEALKRLHTLWQAVQKAPGEPGKTFQASVLAQIGWAHEQLGNTPMALSAFEKAFQLCPTAELQQRIAKLKPQSASAALDPIHTLLLQAKTQQQAGNIAAAAQTVSQALAIHPDHVDALQHMASLQRQLRAPTQALALLQRAIILNPQRADLFNDLGIVFQELGNLPKAISFHKRALKVDPRFVFAMINLGVAYKRQGKFDLAISAYQDALQHAPHMAEAHNNLGNLLRLQGQLSQAKTHLLQALQLKPGYADALNNLSAVEAELNSAAATTATATAMPAPKAAPAPRTSK